MNICSNTQRGSSTIELVIAFAIFVLAITAVIIVLFGNQSVSVDNETNSEALYKAQTLLEQTRALSRSDFSSVASQSSVVEISGSLSYTKKLDVATLDSFTKQATSTVTWQLGGRSFTIVLSTLLTDSQTAAGSKCSPVLTGDWTAPQIYGYVDFPSPKGASGVDVHGSKAYITSDPNSATTDDFYVVDVSAAAPGYGSFSTPSGTHFSTTYGLTDVRTVGNYAYVTADSASYQLLVIGVSNPTNLSPSNIIKKIDLTTAGDTAYGNTLAYSKNKLYVGLTKSSSAPEFHIFDVSSSTNPTEIGAGYKIGAAVNHITIKDNIAYLATASTTELMALDVSTPSSPTPVTSYKIAAVPPYGQAISYDGTSKVYFGRTDTIGGVPVLFAFNSLNLVSPIWSFDVGGYIYTATYRQNVLFVTTNISNDGLQIWDVTNASASVPPVRHDTSPLNIQQGASAGSDCFGNLLYIAQRSNRALQVIGPFVPFGYSLSADQDITVTQGASGTNTITKTLTSGTTQNVTLSATGLPAGATASFSNNPCKPTCASTLTITTAASTLVGTYPITVTGTGGQTTTFNLVVNVAFAYTLNASPASKSLPRGTSYQENVTVTKISGTSQPVTLTLSGFQNNVAVASSTPSTATCTPNSTCTISFGITAAANAQRVTRTITVTGSGTATTTSFVITVP